MRRLSLCTALLIAAAGCSKSEPAPRPPAPIADTASRTPDTAKVEVSPLAELAPTLGAPLDTDTAISGARAAAERLVAWAEAHPDAAEAGPARLAAARAQLLIAVVGPPEALAATATPLAASLDALAAAGVTLDGADPARLASAARAVAALAPGATAPAAALTEALALAAGEDDAALAVRAAWLAATATALDALDPTGARGLPGALPTEGARLLCPGCAEAGGLAPDALVPWLLEGDRGQGLLCASPEVAAATDPAARARALLACDGLRLDADAEPQLAFGANALELGMLKRAHALTAPPTAAGPLAPIVTARREALLAALRRPFPLPIPTFLAPLPAEGERPADSTLAAPVAGLAAAGLDLAAPAAELFAVGPDGVRAGLRPTLGLREDKLVSLSRLAEAALDSRPPVRLDGAAVLTLAALAEAQVVVETGAVAEIAEAAQTLQAMAALVAGPPAVADAPRVAELVVDALAPTAAVARTLDSARAAGFTAFRFTRPDGGAAALVVRDAPTALPAAATPGFERPILVHVTASGVEVWGPEKPADPAPVGDAAAALPEGAEAGYRGTTLVRLRVARGDDETRGLSDAGRAKVSQAVAYWRQSTGHGALVHVVGADDALAADVLRVAADFQAAAGPAIDAPEALWPGASCPAPAAGEAPRPCASGVAVAFSRLAVPSGKGVSAGPKKAEVKPSGPAPSPEFCNERDIKSQMAKQTRDFRFCYESQLRLDERLEGKVTVTFTINLDGSVSNVSAGGTLKNDKVHSCLTKAVQKLRFGQPDGGRCLVRWPFVFQKR